MKLKLLAMTAAIAASAALVLTAPINANANPPAATGSIVWNGTSDKAVAATIDAVPSTRTNASGTKITSNAQSADVPGVYFIWDSKQKDVGYLKVDASVFDTYSGFVLTAKESNTYWDFQIALQPGQSKTADGCYVFFIPKVGADAKNINMVFLDGWTKPEAPTLHDAWTIEFIGYYVFGDGLIFSTTVTEPNDPNTAFTVTLAHQGDCINWDDVNAAYTAWAAKGGLVNPGNGWLSSGDAKYFDSGADICYGDLGEDQLEGYYHQIFLDPSYTIASNPVLASYDRYLADVHLWNDLYQSGERAAEFGFTQDDWTIMAAEGGLTHYQALCDQYGVASLPPYYHFEWSQQVLYDQWANALEVGLIDAMSNHAAAFNNDPQAWLTNYQQTFDVASFVNPPIN